MRQALIIRNAPRFTCLRKEMRQKKINKPGCKDSKWEQVRTTERKRNEKKRREKKRKENGWETSLNNGWKLSQSQKQNKNKTNQG